jgi:hypothetical protein
VGTEQIGVHYLHTVHYTLSHIPLSIPSVHMIPLRG